jgi:hypothetical protein
LATLFTPAENLSQSQCTRVDARHPDRCAGADDEQRTIDRAVMRDVQIDWKIVAGRGGAHT